MKKQEVVFLGGGVMAEAIIKGLLSAELVPAGNITAIEISSERRAYLNENYGINATDKGEAELKNADVFILAIKPQVFEKALDQRIITAVNPETLVISIVAGKSLKGLQHFFGGQQPLLRAMPNTPLSVGEGMTVLCKADTAGEAGVELARKIFSCSGQVLELPESQLDAVTGLSGSGPGYLFLIIDAMADAGVLAGLPRDIAIKLAAQTVLGSGKLVLESGKHPGQLRDQVASPGGTTIAGIAALERAGVRAGIIDAVIASAEKSRSFDSK